MASDRRQPTDQRPVWDRQALRAPHARPDKAARVRAMFEAIAPSYERVNRLATFGRDAAWRRAAVRAAAVRRGDVVLDLCCGTGDMIRAFARGAARPALIIGIDFAANMLGRGAYRRLGVPLQLLRADALRLPLADGSVDVISCAFGVRNFQHLARGLGEMHRVARRGARVVILEFALPERRGLGWGYRWYCQAIVPRIAGLISRDQSGAYRYLSRSIETFEPRRGLASRLEAAGFRQVRLRGLNLGPVVLYRGVKR